jgi:uncharacterized protein YndB with AHSA1/START domain
VTVTRARTVGERPEVVWALVDDPGRLPRWWPHVERVQGATADAWTAVMRSPRGRPVHADWRLVEHEAGRRRTWALEIEGTPFARILAERSVTAALEPAAAGTMVTLAIDQRGRGWARFGGPMLRRAAVRELEAALDGLEEALR